MVSHVRTPNTTGTPAWAAAAATVAAQLTTCTKQLHFAGACRQARLQLLTSSAEWMHRAVAPAAGDTYFGAEPWLNLSPGWSLAVTPTQLVSGSNPQAVLCLASSCAQGRLTCVHACIEHARGGGGHHGVIVGGGPTHLVGHSKPPAAAYKNINGGVPSALRCYMHGWPHPLVVRYAVSALIAWPTFTPCGCFVCQVNARHNAQECGTYAGGAGWLITHCTWPSSGFCTVKETHHHANAHHGIKLAGLGHGLGHHRQLKAAWHPAHLGDRSSNGQVCSVHGSVSQDATGG